MMQHSNSRARSSPDSFDVCHRIFSLTTLELEPNKESAGRKNNIISSSSSSLLFLIRSLKLKLIVKVRIVTSRRGYQIPRWWRLVLSEARWCRDNLQLIFKCP
jgi:hypothetical protein